MAFRRGAEDLEFLEEKQFGPDIIATDLLNLPNYNIYLRLMIDGVPSRPFSAITLPPAARPEVSYENEIIDYSRKTYSAPRAEVEKAIAKATGVEEAPLGDNPSFSAKSVDSESKRMFDAVCSNCKKEIKVPFNPDPSRPVYCQDCFEKMKQKPIRSTGRSVRADRPAEGKKQRKSVDMEGLMKILEETFPKKEEK